MARRSTIIKTTIGFILPAAAVIAVVWWFFAELQPVDANNTDVQTVVIQPGSGVRTIARQLQDNGVIRNAIAFEIAVGLGGLSKDLQAGTFELKRSMSATEIARAIGRGSAVKEVVLTIPEGWSSRQIGAYVEKQGIGTETEFVSAASVVDSRTILPDEQFDFLAGRPSGATLEGYLFPDTYRVFPDSAPVDVIAKMLNNFGLKITPELRTEATKRGHTLHEVIVLASIIEREVRTDRDRQLVADIFWRRLAAGTPLQSDATVNYVTGKNVLQPTLADTEVDSPYNTYKYRGLPPGPIGNPGLSSITAALRPEANDFFYFLTDGSGTVHYAKTYDEHLENKRKFL